ncbi:50S ribosomal protein L6 [Candidatus Hepatincolaceae symbiont of Richtersius coronifer]
MSRVGKYPIILKNDITVDLKDNILNIKGKKGEANLLIPVDVQIKHEDNTIAISPQNDTLQARKLWGSFRALINNMVIGVSEGFKITLDISGVGYRATVQGKNLVLQLGFSHDIIFPIPEDISIVCPDATHITIEGLDKQKVGQVAAKIRAYKKPEPYKGKGIKYSDEVILRKEGKKK